MYGLLWMMLMLFLPEVTFDDNVANYRAPETTVRQQAPVFNPEVVFDDTTAPVGVRRR